MKRGSKSSSSSHSKSKADGSSMTSLVPASLLQHLHNVCSSSESHPFVRPFGNMVSVVHMCCHDRPAPFPVGPAMAAAAAFLGPSVEPAQRLAFAIESHMGTGARQFLGEVGGALAVLSQKEDRRGLIAAVQDMLEKWDGFGAMFSQRCQEVWELYVYFVFVDIKGDRSLIEQVMQRLCGFLECSPQHLSLALAHTRPWAEKVLESLASKDFTPLLSKLHAFFLCGWHTKWQQALSLNGSPPRGDDSGSEFWETWFSGRFKVPFPDFVDAFQASYMENIWPTDVANRLHILIDPARGHHVEMASWEKVLRKCGSINGMMETLLDGITKDIGAYIYRPKPLPIDEGATPTETLNTVAEESTSRHSSSQKKSQPSPYTKDSEGVLRLGAKEAANPTIDTSTCETPPDRLASKPSGTQLKMTWDEYHARLSGGQRNNFWWLAPGEQLTSQDMLVQEESRVNAIRVVQSNLFCTDQALLLRIITGDLGRSHPILDTRSSSKSSQKDLPAVVVMANSGRSNGVLTFGRGSAHGTPAVDHVMPEPIISRAHFSIVYDQQAHSYGLCDNGTKWGTFVQVTKPMTLKCGDWIRVGVAEMVIRYCGGGCSCHKWHGQYRAQSSMGRARKHGYMPHVPMQRSQSLSALPLDSSHEAVDSDPTSTERPDTQIKDEIALLLSSSRRSPGWTSTSTRLSRDVVSQTDTQKKSEEAQSDEEWAPIKPLELEFISGPRMGEKVSLWDRVSTLGRCASNTVQVHDPSIANVSRVHCVFEYRCNRWQIRDNKSTNGTWKRLSCILEPSKPLPLVGGEVIMAGSHEFKVEALNTPQCVSRFPSVVSQVLGQVM